jgi:hypothetical protein
VAQNLSNDACLQADFKPVNRDNNIGAAESQWKSQTSSEGMLVESVDASATHRGCAHQGE